MSILQDLQSDVVSVNYILKQKIHEMDYIELLRNCHPHHRSDYAHRLFKDKLISEEAAKEFTKIIGNK